MHETESLKGSPIALDAGLCQPHDARATLARGPAARQVIRINGQLLCLPVQHAT